jgi:hypothetical protein
VKLSDEQWRFTLDSALFVFFADANGFKLTDGHAWRTQYQQDKYYADGLSWTLKSYHLKRLAKDYNIFFDCNGDGTKTLLTTAEEMEKHASILGRFWASLDEKNESGFDWTTLKDYGHFQRTV